MYKMAVLDIDGTISPKDNMISQRVINTIHATIEKGFPVCVCTGRNLAHTKPIIGTLGTSTPFATIDGLVAFNPPDNKIIFENKLSEQMLVDIAEVASGHSIYIEAVTKENYNKYVVNAPKYDYGLGKNNSNARYYGAFEEFLKIVPSTYEFIFGGSERDVQKLQKTLTEKYGDALGIRHALWAGYIFVAAPQSGKAFGVRRLCEHFGVDMSEVVCIGDDLNDLDMLEEAGMGVAMGNAVDRAKEVSDYITDTVENDGVALALERFFK